MLLLLQRWAYDHDIRLKLFNPCKSVQDRLEHAGSMPDFDIATLDEMMALLARADSRYALAVFVCAEHVRQLEGESPLTTRWR